MPLRRVLYLGMGLLLLACSAKEGPSQQPELADLQGQWVVINYWAAWCKPCIAEIPELNALHKKYPMVTVLGVNYDGTSGSELAQQERKLGVEFATMASDPAAQLGVPRPIVLPTTLIVDPAGQVVAALVGPQTLDSLALATEQVTSTH